MKRSIFLFVLLSLIIINRNDVGAITRTVCASGCTYNNTQLQTALDAAQPGDIVLLQENFEYVGDFELRAKTCPANDSSCIITVRTGVSSIGVELALSNFPAADIRITPTYANNLAKLRASTNNSPALRTDLPSTVDLRWWLIKWLQFNSNSYGGSSHIHLGADDNTDQATISISPNQITIDQVYFKADSKVGQHRGVSINARNVTVRNSYFQDFKAMSEGQTIWVNSTPGPVTITNNYMDGGSETFLTGGSSGCCRPTTTVVSNATTTSAVFSGVVELSVGQGMTLNVASVEQYGEVVSIGSSTCTGSANVNCVVWTPALTAAPDIPGDVDWGVLLKDLSFTKNYVTKNLSYRNPIIGTPVGVSATPLNTGSLGIGTYFYRVVARHSVGTGNTGRSTASAEVSATTTGIGIGSVQISWNAVVDAEEYYIYGRNAGGQSIRFSVTAPTVTFTDTGAAGTAENVPTSTGTKWNIKNVFELKNCDTCLVQGNIFENSWLSGHTGMLVILHGTTQDSGNDSSRTRNITFRDNILRHGTGGVSISGRDSTQNPSGRNGSISVTNNLMYDLDSSYGIATNGISLSAGGDPAQLDKMPFDITINHNTIQQTSGSQSIGVDGFRSGVYNTIPNWIITNNLIRKANYGLMGGGEGNGTWDNYKGAGSVYDRNVFAGASCSIYPTGTGCPTTTQLDNDIFTNPSADDYVVKSTSVYYNAGLDGTSYGAVIPTITAFTDISISGNNSGGGGPPEPLIISSIPEFTSALTGRQYSVQLTISGGTSPYTWSVSSGLLPTGITLSSTGLVSGTPTVLETTNFVIQVIDNSPIPRSVATRSGQIIVNEIISLEPRPEKIDLSEGVFFRRESAPTDIDQVRVGDIWYDLTTSVMKVATATSPAIIWSGLTATSTLSPQDITITTTSLISSNTPDLGHEYPSGGSRFRFQPNLLGYTQCSLNFQVLTAGFTGANLIIQYWDGDSWEVTGISVLMDTSGQKQGSYQTLTAAARLDYPAESPAKSLRPYIDDGNGVIDPDLSGIHLVCKP